MRSEHRFRQLGLSLQARRFDGEIAVGGERRYGNVRIAGVKVDGLGAHEDDGVTLLANGVKRIEQCRARDDVERIDHLRPPLAIHSRMASASAGARPGLVSRSTAAWLGATNIVESSFQ